MLQCSAHLEKTLSFAMVRYQHTLLRTVSISFSRQLVNTHRKPPNSGIGIRFTNLNILGHYPRENKLEVLKSSHFAGSREGPRENKKCGADMSTDKAK